MCAVTVPCPGLPPVGARVRVKIGMFDGWEGTVSRHDMRDVSKTIAVYMARVTFASGASATFNPGELEVIK
jgi:hypothetical protein